MSSNLRIWRVVPTSKTGVQAPYFFVETQELKREKAEINAIKIANERCSALTRFDEWECILHKVSKRKDNFGRYFKYHQ